MNDKAQGEWTHEKLQGLLQISNEDRYVADHAFENTLDEINAALAAERERTEQFARAQAKANARLCEIEDEHQQQLAAEREKHKQHVEDANRLITKLNDTVSQLRQQLAAEREKYELLMLAATKDEERYTNQLAAEQEKRDRVVMDAQSWGGLKLEWRDSDGRHYLYDKDGKFLWSGAPSYNIWRCVKLSREIQQLREQLAAAQAAIERCFNFGADATKADVLELLSKTLHGDTTALDAAISAAQQPLVELLELAWGVIANAGGGDWGKESDEWNVAAVKWRGRYHAALAKIGKHGTE